MPYTPTLWVDEETVANAENLNKLEAGLQGAAQTAEAALAAGKQVFLERALSDESTALTAGNGALNFRMPHAMTVTEVRISLETASSSGLVTVDINEGGVSIFSTRPTIDVGELTSVTAATPAVIADASIADNAAIRVDIDVAGTGAVGLKLIMIGTRP
jgi:hypothetical protein